MPDLDKWSEVVKKLARETEKRDIVWHVNVPFDASIREEVVGNAIYTACVGVHTIIVYEYRYKDFVGSGGSDWTWEQDIAIEFVEQDGHLQWQFPRTSYHPELLDAIRYQVAGADDFLKGFLG